MGKGDGLRAENGDAYCGFDRVHGQAGGAGPNTAELDPDLHPRGLWFVTRTPHGAEHTSASGLSRGEAAGGSVLIGLA